MAFSAAPRLYSVRVLPRVSRKKSAKMLPSEQVSLSPAPPRRATLHCERRLLSAWLDIVLALFPPGEDEVPYCAATKAQNWLGNSSAVAHLYDISEPVLTSGSRHRMFS